MTQQLASPCTFEETIKRSRFIAHAAPISSEAESLAFYEQVADAAATHNCWAWRLDQRYRFNDDGEPSGTAGRPILAAIQGRDLDGVMVVVTRHYGGVKLGVGGLVRAYGGSASKCLDTGTLRQRVHWIRCELRAGFDLVDGVHQLLERHQARKLSEQFYEQGVKLDLEVNREFMTRLNDELQTLSRGQIRLWTMRD